MAAAWDALVERFRDVGDDGAGGPTAEDAAAFKAAFDAFSPERKLERVAEAQNLLPDASIACLAAIMRDAREPTDVLESLLHAVPNRAEGVKAPLIREVARMDGHPLAGECRELLDALGD